MRHFLLAKSKMLIFLLKMEQTQIHCCYIGENVDADTQIMAIEYEGLMQPGR